MRKRTRLRGTVRSVLEEGTKPLLLILDEVQALGNKDVIMSEYKGNVVELLELIHNGKIERPIILLTAGLRTALNALKTLGISRFGDDNTFELGALSEESSRAVICDWIVKHGEVKGAPSEWIDAIEKETYRWPRHIHSYAMRAGEYLRENDGLMTPEGLKEIMEKGMKGRIQYYTQRIESFYVDEIKHVAKAISSYSAGGAFDRLDILSSLSKIYGEAEAKNLFDRLMEKGVVAVKGKDGYSVPLPSMHSWLVDAYVRGVHNGKGSDQITPELPAKPEQLLTSAKNDEKSAVNKKGKG